MILHLQTVPARNGANWIRHGFQVFKRKPMALSALLSFFIFAIFLALRVPYIGVVLMLMALPLLSLAFMLATHQVLQNQTPTVAVFLAPFKLTPERRRTQLWLCLVYALASILISLLAQWIDGGAFDAFQQLMGSNATPEQVAQATADPRLFWGAVSRVGLAALLSVPFWHAPALVHWSGQGLMQALFSSTLGVWRNKGAFAWNSLLWFALATGLSLACSVLVLLTGAGNLLVMLLVPVGLLMLTVFYVSLYFTFIDCFMASTPSSVLDEKA